MRIKYWDIDIDKAGYKWLILIQQSRKSIYIKHIITLFDGEFVFKWDKN